MIREGFTYAQLRRIIALELWLEYCAALRTDWRYRR